MQYISVRADFISLPNLISLSCFSAEIDIYDFIISGLLVTNEYRLAFFMTSSLYHNLVWPRLLYGLPIGSQKFLEMPIHEFGP